MKAECGVGQVNVSAGATAECVGVEAKADLGAVTVTTERTLHRGRVKSFSFVNRWGFLLTDDGDFFFHQRSLQAGYRPVKGDRVQFELAGSSTGRIYAINVRRCD